MRCPRCGSFVVEHVIFVSDGPEGLYVVTDAPVPDHVVACGCGADIAVTSTRPWSEVGGSLPFHRDVLLRSVASNEGDAA